MTPATPYTRQLAEFVFGLRYDSLKEEIVHRAKQCLIDYLASTIIGKTLPHAPKIVSAVRQLGGDKQASIIGFGDKSTVTYAALVNGAMGSTMIDDTCRASLGHPSVGVMPSVLSVGEWKHRNGKEAITAIVAGYELVMRVGAAIGEGAYKRGWHPRGGVNVFGAAAAASVLLKAAGVDEVCHSLSLAGTQASGLIEASYFYDGWHLLSGSASQDGVLAAILAHAGYTGGCTILEGPMGYAQAVSPNPDLSILTKDLGETYGVMEGAMKSYPCTHLTHAAIETTLNLSKKYHIRAANVESVDVGIMNIEYMLDKTFPKNLFVATMSMPFVVAHALRYGQAGPRPFLPESMKDPLLREIFEKINVYVDDEIERQRPRYLGSVVTIRTKDGKTYTETCLATRGDPENPFSDQEIREKFENLTADLISVEKQRALWSRVMGLEGEKDIGALLPLTCP